MFVVPFALVSAAFAQEPACEKATTSQLRTQITEAFGAFANNDGPGFEAAASKVEVTRGCLAEFLLPADAAELHRFQGLRSFYRQEPDYAIQSFQAALALQSGFNLPTSVAPEPGPLWTMYERAKGRPAPATVPLALKGYTVLVDGKLATEHPSMLPYFVQFQAPDGSVRGTSYVLAGQEPAPPAGLAAAADGPVAVKPPVTDPGAEFGLTPKKWRFGLDLGFLTAFRVEMAGKGNLDFGLRLVVAYGVGLEPYLDVRAGNRWDVELGLGGIGGPAPIGYFRTTLQYDPPTPVHLNLGLAVNTLAAVPVLPEVSVGWLW